MASPTADEIKVMKNRREAARSAIKFFSKSFMGVQTHRGIKTVKSANNPFDGLSKTEKSNFYENRDKYIGEGLKIEEYVYKKGVRYEDDEGFVGYVYKKKLYDTADGIEPEGVLFSEATYQFDDSLLGSVAQTMRTGLGNCDEKGKICYSALKCNPRLTNGVNSVSLVSSNNTLTVKKQKTKRDTSGKKIQVEVEVEKEVGYDHVFVVVADESVTEFTKISDLGLTAMIVDGWTQDWYFPNLGAFYAKWHGLGNTPNPRQLVVRGNVKKNPTRAYGAPPDGVGAGQEVGVKKFF